MLKSSGLSNIYLIYLEVLVSIEIWIHFSIYDLVRTFEGRGEGSTKSVQKRARGEGGGQKIRFYRVRNL